MSETSNSPSPSPFAATGEPLCVLTIHAHPDDESSKGAATIAKYGAQGVRTVLVCCTGGELGDIANPAMKKPGVLENLFEIRMAELKAASEIIGFDEVIMLGYRDSGMAESEGNNDPTSFHQAPMEEAVERIVAIIRRIRPQVILTYADDQQGYPHPDHLKVHDISNPAFDRAGDPAWYPNAGEPWTPLKLYYSTWSKARMTATHAKFVELEIKSPYDERWMNRPWQDHRITTRIEVEEYYDVRVNALTAHATQIDPNESFWFGLPHDEARKIHPFEDYILARSRVGEVPGEDIAGVLDKESDAVIRETDLFEGIRSR